jgi:hypothetical protein
MTPHDPYGLDCALNGVVFGSLLLLIAFLIAYLIDWIFFRKK